MTLDDILNIVSLKINDECEFTKPTDMTKLKQAKNFGGIACYSKKYKENGILIVFVINVLDQVQTDAKSFIDSCVNSEEYDMIDLLNKNIYKLKYMFFSNDDDCLIKDGIDNQNYTEPELSTDFGDDITVLLSQAHEGLMELTLSYYSEDVDEFLKNIQGEFNSSLQVDLQNEFMDVYGVSPSILKQMLMKYPRQANLKIVN